MRLLNIVRLKKTFNTLCAVMAIRCYGMQSALMAIRFYDSFRIFIRCFGPTVSCPLFCPPLFWNPLFCDVTVWHRTLIRRFFCLFLFILGFRFLFILIFDFSVCFRLYLFILNFDSKFFSIFFTN